MAKPYALYVNFDENELVPDVGPPQMDGCPVCWSPLPWDDPGTCVYDGDADPITGIPNPNCSENPQIPSDTMNTGFCLRYFRA